MRKAFVVTAPREARTGTPALTALTTISLFRRPVVTSTPPERSAPASIAAPAILSTALWRPTSSKKYLTLSPSLYADGVTHGIVIDFQSQRLF